jgi:hypothetical protein
MNAMTCHDVAEQLDLLAAGECDSPTRQAVERHLEQCPACAARYAESQRLQGLLELTWNEAGLARLRERIEQEDRRTLRSLMFRPSVRRAAALAALVLLTVGLLWVHPRPERWASEPELQLALVIPDTRQEYKSTSAIEVRPMHDLAAFLKASDAVALAAPIRAGQSGEAFRHELVQAQRDNKLPPPPALPVALALRNTGDRSVEVRLGNADSELTLDVRGEGVVRMPAVGVAAPEFLRPQTFQLAPGEELVVRIDRLIAGERDRLEYIYLTEPGEYTVSARLRVTVGGAGMILRSGPMRVRVGD